VEVFLSTSLVGNRESFCVELLNVEWSLLNETSDDAHGPDEKLFLMRG
jgi:hypothetical protein